MKTEETEMGNRQLAMTSILDSIQAVLFPRLCVYCEDPVEVRGTLCDSCVEQLEASGDDQCEVCGQSFDGAFSNRFR